MESNLSMKILPKMQNRSCGKPATGKLRLVVLLQVLVVLFVLVGTVMLTIQMHFIHVHLSDFTSSVDTYMHQQLQKGSYSANGVRNSNTSIRMTIDDEVEPILKILRQGGYTDDELDAETISSLPKWSTILEAYGPPKIIGLESCKQYRNSINPHQRTLAVAGTFNSGTNLLHSLLTSNCKLGTGQLAGILWQVRQCYGECLE